MVQSGWSRKASRLIGTPHSSATVETLALVSTWDCLDGAEPFVVKCVLLQACSSLKYLVAAGGNKLHVLGVSAFMLYGMFWKMMQLIRCVPGTQMDGNPVVASGEPFHGESPVLKRKR